MDRHHDRARCWLTLNAGLLGALLIAMLDDMGVVDKVGAWHVAWLVCVALFGVGVLWVISARTRHHA
jgi:hypothetical protein